MKVWIDLSNSPHPLLFAPIVRDFKRRGDTPLITVRDHAQTRELAYQRWPAAEVVGGRSPGGRVAKARGIVERIRALGRWARLYEPDVALSHNSYAQLVAARLLGIPSVTAMDFEYQPANHLAFRSADRILLPEAVPASVVRRQGARPGKVVRYSGLKEELYLDDFEPDADVLDTVGVGPRNGNPVVVLRSAPRDATYHRGENPIFLAALERFAGDGATCIVLPRYEEQRAQVASLGLSGCIVPGRAVDARSLLGVADAFVGAGGTMTREAAMLGVPSYSIFAGRRPAVDRWLAAEGMLFHLESVDQIPVVQPRERRALDRDRLRRRARELRAVFIEAVVTTAESGGQR